MSTTSEIALHTVRVFSAFLTSCLEGQQSGAKEGAIHKYIPLAIDVYNNLVKSSIETNERVLRTSAIAIVQLLLQFHGVAVTSASSHGYDKGVDALARDAVHMMKQLIMLEDTQVLAACIRAVAYTRLDLEPNFAEDALRMIYHVMEHSANRGTQVTKFCMSSMIRVMENLINQFPYLLTDNVLQITYKGNSFAVDALRNLGNVEADYLTKSSSDRASEESNKTAAVGLIASHISVQKSIEEKKLHSKEFAVEESAEIHILRQLLRNNTETLNLRCCTCRALGRVVTLHSSSLGQQVSGILLDIVASMNPVSNIRLQICSASSLIQILKSLKVEDFHFAILHNSINCFLAVTSQMKGAGVTPKLRIQLNTLLHMIGELIFAVFHRASPNLLTEAKNKWEKEWEPNILIACVSSYISLSKYVKYEREYHSDMVIESTPVALRDVMRIILHLTSLLKTSFGHRVSERGESQSLAS
ncbi:hypothetical protein FGB62_56g115 [Gracilaria domingensis]|nr:hypothetical protein FGB62_56g115 [Gracilaria domingensis]